MVAANSRRLRRRRRIQFSLATMLWIMVLAALMLAFFGGILREAHQVGSTAFLVFLVLLLSAPLTLVVVVAFGGHLRTLWMKHRRR